jgi:thioredoxin 1
LNEIKTLNFKEKNGISNNRRYFEEVVLKSDKPVMVDFGQHGVVLVEWLDQLLMSWVRNDGKVVVGKVDVDANQEFAAKYGVRNIPTVLIFHNGEVVASRSSS